MTRASLVAFEEVTQTYRSFLGVEGLDAAILVQPTVKSALLHPVRIYINIIRRGRRAYAEMGSLAVVPLFPTERMLVYLSRFTTQELAALKSMAEVGLRRRKLVLTDSPVLKYVGGIGSLYAFIQLGNKLVPSGDDSSFGVIRDLLDSPWMQSAIGYLLGGFVFTLILFGVHYVLLIAPAIGQAQLLDDLLALALHDRAFENAEKK